jgi:hypothetical protein
MLSKWWATDSAKAAFEREGSRKHVGLEVLARARAETEERATARAEAEAKLTVNLPESEKPSYWNEPREKKHRDEREIHLARLYCADTPFWHCSRDLAGDYPEGETFHVFAPSELMDGPRYTFDELNYPKNWLKVVRKYTQQEPSPAVRQLHRLVEESRREFKARQATAYGNRKVEKTEGMEEVYRKEDKAWDTFNAKKAELLKCYLKDVSAGEPKKKTCKRRHRCKTEDCEVLISGRSEYCSTCIKSRKRDSTHRSRHSIIQCGEIIKIPILHRKPLSEAHPA